MTEVIINNKSTINAEGTHNTKGCKHVVCLTTRKVYTSGLDAAIKENVDKSSVSRCCHGKMIMANGKKFCLLKDVAQHLDEIFELDRETIEKAVAYDAIKAEERAAREAEEKYAADLAKAEEQCTFLDTLISKLSNELVETQRSCEEAYAHLQFLRETGVQYAI